jgi:pimeloyl-[acyl-carrier protein] methyl ester esterase
VKRRGMRIPSAASAVVEPHPSADDPDRARDPEGWSAENGPETNTTCVADNGTLLLLLLPGLDGTGKLFTRFVEYLPANITPRVVTLPMDRPRGYADLVASMRQRLPVRQRFALLAESFSGPIALHLAAERPDGLVGVTLVASFHRRPVAGLLAALRPLASLAFKRPPPGWAIRHFLAGSDAPAELVAEIRSAVAEVPREVMATRVHDALRVDATGALAACPVPLLYLSGSHDRLVRRALVREMSERHPALEHRELAAPHLVLQRQPREAAKLVSDFLGRATGDPRSAGGAVAAPA